MGSGAEAMFGDFTWNVVEKEAECLAERFRAVTRNIANVNTPGYARRNVSFEDQMRQVLERDKKLHMTVTDAAHIPSHPLSVKDVEASETQIKDERYRLDQNNVDPEREMAALAETRMMYTAMMRIASNRSSTLRSIIAGR